MGGLNGMRFAQRLKLLRKELDLNQEELAQACGVKLSTISKYENDVIKPAFEMLSKMGFAYNINLNWLVNEIGEMFIETAHRKLIKSGTEGFYVEIFEPIETAKAEKFVSEGTHSLELESDLKVEYYGPDNEKYTKIYYKNGELETSKQETDLFAQKIEELTQKLKTIDADDSSLEFISTAIDALDDTEAVEELKVLIKVLERSKNKKW